MAKRTRKKRKISPIKKTLRKRNLARNFIVLLSLIFILLLFAYFFLSKNNQAVNSSSNNNILQSQKLYTNDEIMEEVIQNLNPDIKNNILEKDLETEKTKKESFEEDDFGYNKKQRDFKSDRFCTDLKSLFFMRSRQDSAVIFLAFYFQLIQHDGND
jgi:hypothetical protein